MAPGADNGGRPLSPDDLAWLAGFNRDDNRLGTVPTKPVLAVDLDPAGDAGAWNRGAEQSGEHETVRLDPPPGDGDLIDPAHPIRRGADR